MANGNGRIITNGAGGRRIIVEKEGPARVALPMHCIDEACTPAERAILLRFTEASELAKGNLSVVTIDGEARGRYEEFAQRVDVETYAKFEVEAYRWILRDALGKGTGTLAEMIARMNGERTEINFEQWGGMVANTDDRGVALGAAIGSARALAWLLADAYRDYYEFWRIRETAAKHGRALTEPETVQRVRRGQTVRRAYEAHRPQITDGTKGEGESH